MRPKQCLFFATRYSQLNLILGLIDEEQKLFTTLGEALSGRIKLCLHAAIPMAEIYELDMIIDAYFSECIDLTFTELAALANMSEKSVRNAFLSGISSIEIPLHEM